MKKLRFAFLGFAVGFLAASVPSCSAGSRCSPESCGGCCDVKGNCRLGDLDTECGFKGQTCEGCPGGKKCVQHACQPDTGSGGGTGTGGGDAMGGGDNTGGGNATGGGATGGGGTGGGTPNCNPSTCSGGCCAPNGECITLLSQSNLVCGKQGEACGPCTGAMGLCNTATGTCQAPATCGPSNCAGCCDGTTCLSGPMQNTSKCGMGGLACAACPANNACSSGACQSSVCNASTCAGGCCSDAGTCTPYAMQNNATCGTQGAACTPCPQGEVCNTAGQCLPTGTLGGPCTVDATCATLGAGAYCKKMTSRGFAYNGGYCTVPCTTVGENKCGPGNMGDCRGGNDDPEFYGYGEQSPLCIATCPSAGQQSSCRPGYLCYGPTAGQPGFCWLNPAPAYDPGLPSNKVGNGCTSDTQCQSPPAAAFGFCVPPHDGGVGGTFYTNGYCSAKCASDTTGGVCGANAFCGFETDTMNNLTGAAQCYQKCTLYSGKAETRQGYACWTAFKTDGGPVGMVFPSCDAVPSVCGPPSGGLTCNTTNGYCCNSMNCFTGLNYRDLF